MYKDEINEKLKKYAEIVESELEQSYDESTGFMYSSMVFEPRRPWNEGDTAPPSQFPQTPGYETLSYDGVLRYENSGMVLGTFLSAMCFKYRSTGDHSALEKAARTFRGIAKIYDLSQPVAPGFFCKPWGGKMTDELSSDQCIYSMTGMDDYYPLASEEEQKKIRSMIPAIADFWMSHNYIWKYLGKELHWQRGRFIGMMALAFKYSGDVRFEKEMEKLLGELRELSETPYKTSYRERSRKKDGKIIFTPSPEACLSSLISLLPAMKQKDDPVFREIFDLSYRQGILGVITNGTSYSSLWKDSEDGVFYEMDPAQAYYTPVPPEASPIYGLIGPFRKGGMQPMMFSRFLLLAREYIDIPEDEYWVKNLLMQTFDGKHLTWIEDPYGIFPECMRWMSNVFSGDAAAHWLWNYWKLFGENSGK